MSFILDALRKSETERQRDSAPDLMRSPVVPVRRRTTPWTGLLISVLALALVLALAALAAGWWNGGQGESRIASSQPPPSTSTPAISGTAPAEPVAPAAGPPSDRETSVVATSSAEPRPISDLVRVDPALPRYTLSFLDYNATTPDRSSAWIDGQRYYPGQVIAGGPELVGIRADGALLAWRGQTYLLTTR